MLYKIFSHTLRRGTFVCKVLPVVSIASRNFKLRLNPYYWKDDEGATEKQRELSDLLQKGAMRDYFSILKSPDGKEFISLPHPIPISQAKRGSVFPKDEPVLVGIALKPYATGLEEEWRVAFRKLFPNLKTSTVIALDNIGYKLIGPLMQLGLGKISGDFVGVHYTNGSYFKVNKAFTELDLVNVNRFAAHIYLVFNNAVRWRAVGAATEQEIGHMKQVVSELLAEAEKQKSSPSATTTTTAASASPPPLTTTKESSGNANAKKTEKK